MKNHAVRAQRRISPAYTLLAVPDWLGSTHKTGVELGPARLASKLLESDIGKYFGVRVRHVMAPEPDPAHAKGKYTSVKYLPEIRQMCLETQREIIAIIDSGATPTVLMGDCSSIMGVLSGVSKVHGNRYGVVYFDAHGDLNTPESSPSGKIYGMPLAHLFGYGNKELTALNGAERALRPENIVMIGPRELDAGEVERIKRDGILLYSSDDANRKGVAEMVDAIEQRFRKSNATGIFIHVDLDVLDPVESPGVSLHEKGGMKAAHSIGIISELARRFPRKLGLSVAEYNPKTDVDEKTAEIAVEIVRAYLGEDGGEWQ